MPLSIKRQGLEVYYSSIALDASISFSVNFGFKKPYIKAETKVPTTKANNVCKIWLKSVVAITKIPPCGALILEPNANAIAPPTPEPIIIDGITRIGSAAANGIAPSVMNHAPIT